MRILETMWLQSLADRFLQHQAHRYNTVDETNNRLDCGMYVRVVRLQMLLA